MVFRPEVGRDNLCSSGLQFIKSEILTIIIFIDAPTIPSKNLKPCTTPVAVKEYSIEILTVGLISYLFLHIPHNTSMTMSMRLVWVQSDRRCKMMFGGSSSTNGHWCDGMHVAPSRASIHPCRDSICKWSLGVSFLVLELHCGDGMPLLYWRHCL